MFIIVDSLHIYALWQFTSAIDARDGSDGMFADLEQCRSNVLAAVATCLVDVNIRQCKRYKTLTDIPRR